MGAVRRLGRSAWGVAAILSVLCALPATASAAAGDLDPSWGGTGFVTTPFPGLYSFANGVLSEEGVVAVGGVLTPPGDFAIAAYRRNGSLNPSFGTGGEVVTDFNGGQDLAAAAAYQGDKLVVVGYTSPPPGTDYDFAIARYNRNGSLDQSFGNGGKVVTSFGGEDFADAVVVNGDKIVVAGATSAGGGGENFALARYNRNGSLDQSFGNGGKVITDFNGGFDSANGVTLMGDRILAAGYVGGADSDFGLARYNRNGSLDQSFGNGGKVTTDFGHGNDYGHAVDVTEDRIVVVGSASNGTNQDFAAARYRRNGAPDPSFGSGGKTTLDLGGDDEAFGGAVQDNGKVVAAGASPMGVFGPGHFAVARFTASGAPDPSFGPGTGFVTTQIGADSGAYALALADDQKIVAAGYSNNDFAVARYLGGPKADGGDGHEKGGGGKGD